MLNNYDSTESLKNQALNLGNAIAHLSMKDNPYVPIFQEQALCQNRYNHVSAFPGFGRKLCETCKKVYVRK